MLNQTENHCILKNIHPSVSYATLRNWKKLQADYSNKLLSRANKQNSKKRILPLEYFSNKENINFVQTLLEYIDEKKYDISSVIYSLSINLLNKYKILSKNNVYISLSEYDNIPILSELLKIDLPDDEFDILGLIYQCLLFEGTKNTLGSYYTPKKIIQNMTNELDFTNNQSLLDPCCGSGAFLLSANVKNPEQLYGIDNDPIAVLIAKINLLIKYSTVNFLPQIYCFDFLQFEKNNKFLFICDKKFDYIVTNPPWGGKIYENDSGYVIDSKESFSHFFVKSFFMLKKHGKIRFLFPEAILNVKTHKDIRKYITENTKLVSITYYDNMFSGVTTNCVDIECVADHPGNYFEFYSNSNQKTISIQSIFETNNLIFNFLTTDDISIIHTIKNKGNYSLINSTWALGIVTGNNKEKLSSTQIEGMEQIYTGKEIQKYTLKQANKYLFYDRNKLQQVAKESIYRSNEKLVYKFISNELVFAYDDSKSLFLNSANILIPNIPNMSIKTVMAFLNSSLFQFLYTKLFGEIKVLKGNLEELPFPNISKKENTTITNLVDDVLNGNLLAQSEIDEYIFSLYNLTNKQISYIKRTIDGKTD